MATLPARTDALVGEGKLAALALSFPVTACQKRSGRVTNPMQPISGEHMTTTISFSEKIITA